MEWVTSLFQQQEQSEVIDDKGGGGSNDDDDLIPKIVEEVVVPKVCAVHLGAWALGAGGWDMGVGLDESKESWQICVAAVAASLQRLDFIRSSCPLN